jgi:hypothetical protein
MSVGWATPVEAPEGATLGGVERDVRPSARSRARGQGRLWLAAGLGAVSIALLLKSSEPHAPAAPSAPESVAASAIFRARTDLPPLLSVQSANGGREALTYVARRRDSDGERRDTLTIGDPGSNQAFSRLMAHVMSPASQPSDLFVELARQAAEIGLAVDRASSPQRYAADRGVMLVSELALEGIARRSCIGFRLDGPGVYLSGMACEAVGKAIERQALDCLLDRLQATPAGVAKGLDALLGAPPTRRPACPRPPS